MPATKRAFLNKSLTALGAVVAVSAAVVAGNPAVASHVTHHPAAVSSTKVLATAANPHSATQSRYNAWKRDRPYPSATVVIRQTAANPHSATRSRYNPWMRDRTFQSPTVLVRRPAANHHSATRSRSNLYVRDRDYFAVINAGS